MALAGYQSCGCVIRCPDLQTFLNTDGVLDVVRFRKALVASVAVLMVATLVPGCIDESVNTPPRAFFDTSVTVVDVGALIVFDATNSSDEDGSITSYHWDFGDGNERMGVTTHYIYDLFGVYNVTLTVTDDLGKKSIFVQTIIVNALPRAVLEATPLEQYIGNTVTFSAESSEDPDGTIASYDWDFGEGNRSSLPSTEHAYGDVGSYMVTLTVTDNRGAVAQAVQYIQVGYRSYIVNFTMGGGNLDNQRDYTRKDMTTTLNATIDVDNLHLVRLRLTWRDNVKPPGGPSNDLFRITVTPPDGFGLNASGTTENLTLLFPLASIPINRTMEGKDEDAVRDEVTNALGSNLGKGTWLIQIQAVECGGWRDTYNTWFDDPGNYWDLAIHYDAFDYTVTTTE